MENGKIEFAVKALIFNGEKFLAVHKSAIQSQRYELPGGRMLFGETAEETVKREVLEETGLRVVPLKLVDTWNYVTESHQITGIIYLCASESLDNIVLSDEHDRYEWLCSDTISLEKMNRLFRPQMLTWDWNALKNITRQ